MIIEQYLILFIITFALTMLSCYNGDDDVVYKFFGRSPTGTEAIARIRYVLIKCFTMVYGGGILSLCVMRLFVQLIIEWKLRSVAMFLQNEKDYVIVSVFMICVGIMGLVVGLIQNLIRIMQGRTTRPIFDPSILKNNFGGWARLAKK